MAEARNARSRGHQIEVRVTDDGSPEVDVDGEAVPVRVVDGGYAVGYLAPAPDLLEAAKQYVARLT